LLICVAIVTSDPIEAKNAVAYEPEMPSAAEQQELYDQLMAIEAARAMKRSGGLLSFFTGPKKLRSACIRRGGSCDNRANDCCTGGCRCNLWGANCKCARQGLLQKWVR